MTQQWPCKLPVDHQNKLSKLESITNQTYIEQIMQEDYKGGRGGGKFEMAWSMCLAQ